MITDTPTLGGIDREVNKISTDLCSEILPVQINRAVTECATAFLDGFFDEILRTPLTKNPSLKSLRVRKLLVHTICPLPLRKNCIG